MSKYKYLGLYLDSKITKQYHLLEMKGKVTPCVPQLVKAASHFKTKHCNTSLTYSTVFFMVGPRQAQTFPKWHIFLLKPPASYSVMSSITTWNLYTSSPRNLCKGSQRYSEYSKYLFHSISAYNYNSCTWRRLCAILAQLDDFMPHFEQRRPEHELGRQFLMCFQFISLVFLH